LSEEVYSDSGVEKNLPGNLLFDDSLQVFYILSR